MVVENVDSQLVVELYQACNFLQVEDQNLGKFVPLSFFPLGFGIVELNKGAPGGNAFPELIHFDPFERSGDFELDLILIDPVGMAEHEFELALVVNKLVEKILGAIERHAILETRDDICHELDNFFL